jgi:8-oxo-dGTP pyrophosphatase MutT (NUDIX family)
VAHGTPEVLFIKRAARVGDRWTAHVAFPGGKRDATDPSDLAAALRETLEEVGLDLDREAALHCGHLPDRVVTTSWGSVPLMVLCPFVFLLTSPSPPALHLQPTEVASAHWVPLRLLVDPAFRTAERCDVSDRLARRGGQVVRHALRLSLGWMEFAAIRLLPSSSVFSTLGMDFLQGDRELVLWGLTLGILEDLLDMLPPVGHALELWRWPTFTAPDVRFVVAAMSRGLRERNLSVARTQSMGAAMVRHQLAEGKGMEGAKGMEESVVDLGASDASDGHDERDLGESTVLIRPATDEVAERVKISSVNTLLEGYYDIVRKAVWITLAGRAVVGAVVVGTLVARRIRE